MVKYQALSSHLSHFDDNGGDSDAENSVYFRRLFGSAPDMLATFKADFQDLMHDASMTPKQKFEYVVGLGPADDAEAIAWLQHIYTVATGEPWLGQ